MLNSHSFRQLTPVTFLERCGRYYPDRVAIRLSDRDITFGDLLRRSRWLAGVIRNLGIASQSRIALISHNSLAAIDAHFAIPGAGCVIVAINPWLPESEIEKQLRFADASAVIVSEDLLPEFESMLNRRFAPEAIVVFAQQEIDNKFTMAYRSFAGHSLKGASVNSLEAAVDDENAPIAINFTSGTTGDPKGVMYSHRAAYLHALGLVIMVGLTRKSVYFWSLPIFHVSGWGHMWAATAVGAQQELRPEIREFNAKTLCSSVADSGATHLAGAPRLIRLLLEDQKRCRDLDGLTILTGGAAPTTDLIRKMRLLGVELVHQYGLNECLGPFVVCEPQDVWDDLDEESMIAKRLRQGIASVHAGIGLRVINEKGDEVAWDGQTIGEIVMSGNTVAMGYFNNAKATQSAFFDGWFYTGDLAVVHPDGYLEIKDRKKDLIHVETSYGWENVSSIEIENVISRCKGVKDVAVIGVLDEDGNTKIVAFIEFESTPVDDVMLYKSCESVLPKFKIPSQFVEAKLPKTATGKIRKNVLEVEWSEQLLST